MKGKEKASLLSPFCFLISKGFLLSAFSFLVSCEQIEDFSQETDANAVKVVASINKLQTRVAYEDNGTTNFINGDQIRVVNTMRTSKNSATYNFDGSYWTTTDAFVWNGSTTNQFKAWYPATASFDSFDLPTDQSAGIEAADWMTAETEEMTKPRSGVLDLNFVHKLTKVTVTVSFNSQYPAGNNYVSKFHFLTNEETPVEVTPYESMDGYTAILLPGVYAEEASFITLEMNFEDNLTVPVNSTLTVGLEAGKHYNFHLTVGKDAVGISYVRVLDWDEEEIDGGVAEEVEPAPFSVSDDNQVLFSPGNLQYHPKNDIWQFAASQTSYIGDANSNTTSDYDGWIDLFGWSGSEGSAEFGVSSSTDYADYSGDFVDWGTNSIGNYTASTWRTLTHSEWRYLFMERTNASELQGAAQVNGVNGVIILPDSWVCPNGVTFKSGYHSEYSEEAFALYQAFTSAEWSLLETHGAVFLPAAGYRPSPTTSSVQKLGNYWSANASSSENAYVVNTYSNKTLFNLIPRYEACSVRLVKDFCKE